MAVPIFPLFGSIFHCSEVASCTKWSWIILLSGSGKLWLYAVLLWSNNHILVNFNTLDKHLNELIFWVSSLLDTLWWINSIYDLQVYHELNGKVRDAVISLVCCCVNFILAPSLLCGGSTWHIYFLFQIDQEREGEQIDRALLKNVLDIFVEIGMGQMDYYENDFEAAMLKDTASYYSRKASNWILEDSCPDYMLKVTIYIFISSASVCPQIQVFILWFFNDCVW